MFGCNFYVYAFDPYKSIVMEYESLPNTHTNFCSHFYSTITIPPGN